MATDVTQLMRDWLSQWEQATNSLGAEVLRSPEFTRTLHSAQAAMLTAQSSLQPLVERALVAANLPTRSDVEELATRLTRIEAQLARIEAAIGGAAPAPPTRPKPSRTRQPATPAAS